MAVFGSVSGPCSHFNLDTHHALWRQNIPWTHTNTQTHALAPPYTQTTLTCLTIYITYSKGTIYICMHAPIFLNSLLSHILCTPFLCLLSPPSVPPPLPSSAFCWLTVSHQGGFLTNGAKWSRATVAAGRNSALWGYCLALLLQCYLYPSSSD